MRRIPADSRHDGARFADQAHWHRPRPAAPNSPVRGSLRRAPAAACVTTASAGRSRGGQQPDKTAVQSAMAESLAKQRVAVMKQIAGVMGKAPTPAASFFTVPWVETPVPFSSPPCDPMPAADLDKLVEQSVPAGRRKGGVDPRGDRSGIGRPAMRRIMERGAGADAAYACHLRAIRREGPL